MTLDETIADLTAELAAEKKARERAEERASALNKIGVDTQMLAHKWMVAHDRLKAGLPYDFPKPADTPECIAKLEKAKEALERIAECERYTRAGGATQDDLHDYEVGLDEAVDIAAGTLAALGDD